MQTGFTGRRLAWICLTVAPLLGLAAIGFTWVLAHQHLRGESDVVLLLVGPIVSAALTATFCGATRVDRPDAARASMLSFGFSFFWSLLAFVAIELYLGWADTWAPLDSMD